MVLIPKKINHCGGEKTAFLEDFCKLQMEINRSSESQYASIFFRTGGKVALKRAVVPFECQPYSNYGEVKLGDYLFSMPETHTREEFETEFNKNEILHAFWDNSRWTVQPKKNIYGASGEVVNVYSNSVEKRIELRGSDYYLVENRNFDISEDNIHFFPGELNDSAFYKKITSVNAISVGTIGNQICLEGSAFTFSKQNYGAKQKSDVSLDFIRSNVNSSQQDSQIFLDRGDIYVTNEKFPGVFTIDLQGLGEGFLMDSCEISVVKNHADCNFFSFRLRAGECIDLKHCSQTLPLDSRAKSIFLEVVNNKVEVWQNVEGVLAKILQGNLSVPNDCSMCFTGTDKLEFAVPQYQEVKNFTSDLGSLCVALETPVANDYTILQTNLIKLSVSGGQLQCNEVQTNLSIQQGTPYVVSASFVGLEIQVSVLDLNTSVLTQYESTSDEGAFVSQSTYTTDFTAMSVAGKIGKWILVYGNSDILEKQILQEVLSVHWQGSQVNLGGFVDGVFTNGSTLTGDLLTHNAVEYTRVCPKIDYELQQIFRLPEEIYTKLQSTKKGYEERIERTVVRLHGIGVSGLDQQSLIYSGKTNNGHIDVFDPEYFSFFHFGRATLFSAWIDAQDGSEKQFTKSRASYTICVK